MLKTYGDLNLKALREEADLDFAHFTYQKGMCSCCYGPKDLPKSYWRDKVIKTECDYYDCEKEEVLPTEFTYLLFKNSDNGSGCVKKSDTIIDDCIEWGFPMAKLDLVCKILKEQLGDDYYVLKPKSHNTCIEVISKKRIESGISDDYYKRRMKESIVL